MATDLFKNIRPTDGKRSLEWYRKQISGFRGISADRLMTETKMLKSRITPGKMYMFYYDAKYKDVLPYWDKFPLVLPYRRIPEGFFGINLHYLPYGARFKLLNILSEISNNTDSNESKKVQLSWEILNSTASLSPAKACVKHYLNEHVQSRFLEVSSKDWVTAALLPVEQFIGANKNKVWQDTRNKT